MGKYTVIIIVTVGMVLGFFTGLYLYRINQIETQKLADINQEEINEILTINDKEILNTIKVNTNEEKVSPNCSLILKIYYSKCEHLIEKKEIIEDVVVNMTEQEIREKFYEWEIQKFTPTEIVLYKEINEFCNEHFLLKEREGYIAIYKLDENNNSELFRETDISIEYLPKEDLENIKQGIKIYTNKELNKTLEDFE